MKNGKRNQEYQIFIDFIRQEFNYPVDIKKYDKAYVEFVETHRKEILEKLFLNREYPYLSKINEEQFVYWVRDLTDRNNLNDIEFSVDELKEIIQKENFSIFEKSFLLAFFKVIRSKIELEIFSKNMANIIEQFKSEQLYTVEEMCILQIMITRSRIKKFGYRYMIHDKFYKDRYKNKDLNS